MSHALPMHSSFLHRFSLIARTSISQDQEIASPSANDLLLRVSSGDRNAFSQLYDDISPLVFGMAMKTTRSRALAEEVTQETFLQVWRQADRFDPERGSARSWVATIAHRRAVDTVRRAQSSTDREEKVPEDRPAPDVAEFVVDADERRRVGLAMEALTDLQRQAIVLAYFGGFTYREVAELLDAPLGTVKTRMRDGLARMRTTMEKSDE